MVTGLECTAMSAAQALHAARAADIQLRAEANDLVLEAASPPPSPSASGNNKASTHIPPLEGGAADNIACRIDRTGR
jgi:hypothetical protein